jgi:hypothetical protein
VGVIDSAVQRAVKILKASKVEFEIRMPDGSVYGGLTKQAEKKRIGSLHPWGEQNSYIESGLANVKPGDIVVVKVPDGYKINSFQSGITSWCCGKWGQGSYVTARVADGTAIEVMRVS